MDKKEQIINLWKQNFDDPEEFVRFYFDQKYSDENSLLFEEDGKAMSALLMLPYPMSWMDTAIKTSYISGACTQKEARNHGLMTLLLKEAFQEMNKRGIALSTLIPAEEWLYSYYGNLGYAAVFDYSIKKLSINPERPILPVISPDKFDADFANRLLPYFEQKMRSRSCCIQHPGNDYLAIIQENYLSGGRVAATFSPNSVTPTGWALAIPENGIIKVKECFYNSLEEKNALLHHFSQLWQIQQLECKTLPEDNTAQQQGMARITNALEMLQHIARQQPSLSLSIKVSDPQLPQNEGIYLLSEGTCKKQEKQDIPTDIETDIPMLTRALLGYHPDQLPSPLSGLAPKQQPYMNLMLE